MASRAAGAVKSKTSVAKALPSAKPVKKTPSTRKVAEKSAVADNVSSATATVAKPRRKNKVETRTRIYWGVYNQMAKRVAVFEFDQKVEAEKRAAKLLKTSGEHHYIQKLKAVVTQ